MEDVALLRRTIRRCTAILVLTLAITGISLQQASEAGSLILVAMGAFIYLVFEVVEINPAPNHSDDNSGDA
jgi:p-aminobenzoyl-glutamate transporter AbgT